jgi:hypothetical protein
MNTPVIVLNEVESVRRIMDVLENEPHSHSGFPVVEDYDPHSVSILQGSFRASDRL